MNLAGLSVLVGLLTVAALSPGLAVLVLGGLVALYRSS